MVLLGRRQFALLVGRVEISGVRTTCKKIANSDGRTVPDNILLPQYSHLVVRVFHCISFTIRLLTVLGQLNCEQEENNAARKNKNRIGAIIAIKGRATGRKENTCNREKRKKKIYLHSVIYIQEYFPIEKKI